MGITQVKYPALNLKGLVKFICNTLPYCQLRLQCLSYLLALWSQLQSTSGVTEALALSAPPVSVPGRRVGAETVATVKAPGQPTKDGVLYKAWHRADI